MEASCNCALVRHNTNLATRFCTLVPKPQNGIGQIRVSCQYYFCFCGQSLYKRDLANATHPNWLSDYLHPHIYCFRNYTLKHLYNMLNDMFIQIQLYIDFFIIYCARCTGYNAPQFRYKWNIIIIYHDFLPTPRRGSHVKSGKTHTQSSRYTP